MSNTHSLDLEASSSQYASISDANQTGLDITGDLTIEASIKLEQLPVTAGNSFCVISKFEDDSNQRSYRFLLLDTGAIQVYVSGDGTTTNRDYWTSTSTSLLTAGVWTHLAVSYDVSGRSFTVYVNGLSVAGTDTNDGSVSGIYNGTAPVVVGASQSGDTLYFDGLIDEVRVWSDIRTAEEIQDNLGTELVGNEANLVGYWKLNNDYTDETSNGNDLTASGSPVFSIDVPFEDVDAVTSSFEVLNLVASSAQYAYILDAAQTGLDFSNNMSVEGWFKFKTLPSSGNQMTYISKVAGGDIAYYLTQFNDSGTQKLRFVKSPDGTTEHSVTVNYTPTENVWFHLAVTKSDSDVNFYVNCVQQGSTQTLTNSTINNGAGTFQISAASGSIDAYAYQVRVFDDVRSLSEITSDARMTNVSDANLQGEWVFDGDYSDTSGNSNTLTGLNSPTFEPHGGKLTSNLISYWKLDEESGTREDSHGSNDLTDNNTVGFGTGKIENGADFEASNSEYLSITHASQTGLNFTGDCSFSMWYAPESAPPNNDQYNLLCKYGVAGSQQYNVEYRNDSGVKNLRWVTSDNGTTNDDAKSFNYDLGTGTLKHIVFTFHASSSTYKVYVDGVLVGSQTGVNNSIYNGTSNFFVGARVSEEYNDGIIDEVGAWSRTLTAGEVSNLYNAGSGLPYEDTGISFNVADTLALSENITNLRTRSFSITDTMGLSEFVSALKGISFTISESLGLSETLTIARTRLFSITETLGINELLARVKKPITNRIRNDAGDITNRTKNSASVTNRSKS